jgi:hypothetical protein
MTCTRCGQPGRWRSDDELLCAAHGVEAGLRGRRLTLEPAEDVVDRLLLVLTNDDLCREAADKIRRLRARVAELERERAELRAQVQILAEGQPTYPSDLGVWCTAKELSVRCKELAARLVRTAVRASAAEARVAELEAGEGRGGCERA